MEKRDRGLLYGAGPAFGIRERGLTNDLALLNGPLSQYLKPGPPELEAGVLIIQPRRSVFFFSITSN